MSRRPLFATLIAMAMLFAPFAMQTGGAMASTSGAHQAQMTQEDHCGDQPAKDAGGDKSSCLAMCSAVAAAVPSWTEPSMAIPLGDRPSLEASLHSYLAKLATPPPRRA